MIQQASDTVTIEDYHADTSRVGKSMLDVFRQSRRKYYQRFVSKAMVQPEPTAAMLLGSAVHAAVLEPENFEIRFVAAPKCDRRTNAGKATYLEFIRTSADKTVLDADTYAQALRIRDAVFANHTARSILELPGVVEQAHYWRDTESGLDLKCRPDKACDEMLVDLKTCHSVDPEGFARAAVSLGYHRQHEWYRRGWKNRIGKELAFVFLAVSATEPYECAFYELNPDAVELGANQNRTALQQLAACYRNDTWDSPFSTRITRLGLPRWAVYSDEWDILA